MDLEQYDVVNKRFGGDGGIDISIEFPKGFDQIAEEASKEVSTHKDIKTGRTTKRFSTYRSQFHGNVVNVDESNYFMK